MSRGACIIYNLSPFGLFLSLSKQLYFLRYPPCLRHHRLPGYQTSWLGYREEPWWGASEREEGEERQRRLVRSAVVACYLCQLRAMMVIGSLTP
jgi:hypothetical protein